jgi:hypothetical protein
MYRGAFGIPELMFFTILEYSIVSIGLIPGEKIQYKNLSHSFSAGLIISA